MEVFPVYDEPTLVFVPYELFSKVAYLFQRGPSGKVGIASP